MKHFDGSRNLWRCKAHLNTSCSSRLKTCCSMKADSECVSPKPQRLWYEPVTHTNKQSTVGMAFSWRGCVALRINFVRTSMDQPAKKRPWPCCTQTDSS